MRMLLVAASLLAMVKPLLAQPFPDIVLTGQVGENRVTVGRLMGLGEQTRVDVVTPEGFMLSLTRTHNTAQEGFAFLVENRYVLKDFAGAPNIDELWFLNSDCSGLAYIDMCDGLESCSGTGDRLFDHRGQIEGIEGVGHKWILYSVDWNARVSSQLVRASMNAGGECAEILLPFTKDALLPVTVVDPASLGISFGSPDKPIIAEPQWTTSSEVLFCSGFESCP